MKKMAAFIFTLAALILLVGCQKTTITAEISNADITADTVTFDVEINDVNSEITGSIYAKIYKTSSSEVLSSKTIEQIDNTTILIQTITFDILSNSTKYTVKIFATVGRNNIELTKYDFTTKSSDAVHIKTSEEFMNMSSNRTGEYVLDNDLDFTNIDFSIPFATSTKSFSGTFDGQGHTLKNLTLSQASAYTSVFGYVSSATIENVNLDNIQFGSSEEPLSMSSALRSGFLIGYVSSSSAIIKNISVSNSSMYYESNAASSSVAYIGGVIGDFNGTIENISTDKVSINATFSSNLKVKIGGIIGFMQGNATIDKAASDTDLNVTVNGFNFGDEDDMRIAVGGVIGDTIASDNLEVNNIYGTGDININLAFNTLETTTNAIYTVNVGGLIGLSSRVINNAFYTGSISINHQANEYEQASAYTQLNIGGLVGTYSGSAKFTRIVRVGNGASIIVATNNNTHLNVSQSVGLFIKSWVVVDSGIVTYGPQLLKVNNIDQVDNTPSITEPLNFYDNESWIDTAFIQYLTLE